MEKVNGNESTTRREEDVTDKQRNKRKSTIAKDVSKQTGDICRKPTMSAEKSKHKSQASKTRKKKDEEDEDVVMELLLFGAAAAGAACVMCILTWLYWFLHNDPRGRLVMDDILMKLGYDTYGGWESAFNDQQYTYEQAYEDEYVDYRQQNERSSHSRPNRRDKIDKSDTYINADSHPSNTMGGYCTYVCPKSQLCVAEPKLCPCPSPSDVRCETTDWFVCLEGGQKCDSFII